MPFHLEQLALFLAQFYAFVLELRLEQLDLSLQLIYGLLRQVGLGLDLGLFPSHLLADYPYFLPQLTQIVLQDDHLLLSTAGHYELLLEFLDDQVPLV